MRTRFKTSIQIICFFSVLTIPVSIIVWLLFKTMLLYQKNALVIFLLSILIAVVIFIPFKVIIHRFYLLKKFREELNIKIESNADKSVNNNLLTKKFDYIKIGIGIMYCISTIILSIIFFNVETLISNVKPQKIDFFLKFGISVVITFIIIFIYQIIIKKVIELCFYPIGYIISTKAMRLSILSFKPYEAIGHIDSLMSIILQGISLISPLIVIFSSNSNYHFYFALNLALCLLIIPFFLLKYLGKSIQNVIELNSYLIFIQIITSIFVFLITLFSYALFFYLRFYFSKSGISFPFNIPLIFNKVFEIHPTSINYIAIIESMILSLSISLLAVWLVIVFYKKSWVELFTGIGLGLSLFGMPLFQSTQIYNSLESFITAYLSYIPSPSFFVAVLLPFVLMFIVNKLLNTFFSKSKICNFCFYDKIDLYSNFCPFCGVPQSKIGENPEEFLNTIQSRREEFFESFDKE